MKQDYIKPEYVDAIKELRPNSGFEIEFNKYDTLKWYDSETTPPTEQEVEETYQRLMTEFDLKEYYRKRGLEYPSVVDQLDIMYHEGFEGWRAKIKEIKDKYPKPVTEEI